LLKGSRGRDLNSGGGRGIRDMKGGRNLEGETGNGTGKVGSGQKGGLPITGEKGGIATGRKKKHAMSKELKARLSFSEGG